MKEKNAVERKRSIPVYIRLNLKEYEILADKVHSTGLSLQRYGVECLLGATILDAEGYKSLLELNNNVIDLLRCVRGEAANINQIARNSNIEKLCGETNAKTRLKDIQRQIMHTENEVDKLWQSLRQLIQGLKIQQH